MPDFALPHRQETIRLHRCQNVYDGQHCGSIDGYFDSAVTERCEHPIQGHPTYRLGRYDGTFITVPRHSHGNHSWQCIRDWMH